MGRTLSAFAHRLRWTAMLACLIRHGFRLAKTELRGELSPALEGALRSGAAGIPRLSQSSSLCSRFNSH
jgi:hypothetical protein